MDREDFIRQHQTWHSGECGKYDYATTVYHDSKTKLSIRCKIHDIEYWKKPHDHFRQDCPECSRKRKGERISAAKTGKPGHNRGIPCSEEQKEKLRSKAKLRYADSTNHPMWGRHHTEKTKKLIADASSKARGTEMATERTKQGLETRRQRGDDLAFFRGKQHSNRSKELISRRSKTSWTLKRIEHQKEYKKYATLANLDVLRFIDDWRLEVCCKTCGYHFVRTRQCFTESKFRADMCPQCHPRIIKHSKAEIEIIDHIRSIGVTAYLGDRRVIFPLELDIVVPDYKLAIEYCGLYWHGEGQGKGRDYHLTKMRLCEEKGYRLITIFEDEWYERKYVVMNRIAVLLNKCQNRSYARKLNIQEISTTDAKSFCETHHLQGYTKSSIKLGLFDEHVLKSVMTFSHPSIAKGGRNQTYWEMARYCTDGSLVVGGASRLLHKFITDQNPQTIVSFADRRWSNGHLYETLGFELVGATPPNYWYVSGATRIHRFTFRKGIVPGDDHRLTEWENRQAQGLDRIWDCGNLKFVRNL